MGPALTWLVAVVIARRHTGVNLALGRPGRFAESTRLLRGSRRALSIL